MNAEEMAARLVTVNNQPSDGRHRWWIELAGELLDEGWGLPTYGDHRVNRLRAAVAGAIRQCLAEVPPLTIDEAVKLREAVATLAQVRETWLNGSKVEISLNAVLGALDRYQTLISFLTLDEEGAIFEAGRQYGERQEKERHLRLWSRRGLCSFSPPRNETIAPETKRITTSGDPSP